MPRKPRIRPPKPPAPPPSTGSVVLGVQMIGSLDNTANLQAVRMFSDLGAAAWPTVFAHTGFVVIRSTALRSGLYSNRRGQDGDRILANHLGWCKKHGIAVYVNVPTRYQCDGRGQLLAQDLEQFARMTAMGFPPAGYQIQSWGSGSLPSDQCRSVYEKANSLAPRIRDVLTFCEAVPPGRIIVADTLAAKTDGQHNADWDYQGDYLSLVDAMVRAGHAAPSFHQAWAREEAAPDLSDVKAADRFFRGHGWTWGLKPISDSANESAAAFGRDLVGFVADLKREGCLPHELVLTSWNRAHPTAMFPETEPGTLTGAGLGWVALGVVAPRSAG